MHALSQTVLQATKVQGDGSSSSHLDQFESVFARTVGAQHAIALDSPAAALRLALETVGVGEGDEVITTPYNSCKAAEAICALGARPVFVDVKEYSLSMNPRLIASAATKRSKAILVAHTAGLPAEMPSIQLIAGMYGLRVVEDALYAFPAEYRGRMVGGGESDFTCFGFSTGGRDIEVGSGVLCTNNAQWAGQCRLTQRRMSEAVAMPSLEQLAKEESMWIRRTEIARQYNRAFESVPELQIPADRFDCEHAWRLYMLRVHFERLRIGRDLFMKELETRGVEAAVHFVPLHLYSHYCASDGCKPEALPVAFREYTRELSLPIMSSMDDSEVQHVIDVVLKAVGEYKE